VIVIDGAPAGYLQAYRILDHPEYAREVGVVDESYGLDLFLGEAHLVGRAIGPRAIRQFADDVMFGHSDAVAIVCTAGRLEPEVRLTDAPSRLDALEAVLRSAGVIKGA
jgi:hypothetical protein